MSANIFGTRVIVAGKPAWHRIGTVMQTPVSASEAVKIARLDYAILTRPTFTSWPMGKNSLGIDYVAQVAIPDKFAITRQPVDEDPEPRVLGVVGSRYEVVQNMDLARSLDLLTDRWPVESAGALGHGETTFFSLQAGEFEVAGKDLIKKYFLIRDQKDGTSTLRMQFTPVRVVCENTLTLALSGAEASVRLVHQKGVGLDFANRVELVDQFIRTTEETEKLFNGMAKFRVTEENILGVLERTYPMPSKPERVALQQAWKDACDNTRAIRLGCSQMIEKFDDEQPWAAGTAWSLFNAVAETEDYRSGRNVDVSLIWGPRSQTKKRAFAEVLAVMPSVK